MRYLALDQSLRVSGYAIFEDDELVKWGTIETNPNHSIGERLRTIWERLDSLNTGVLFDHVFFEDVQKQVNQDTYKRLCYVQATIMLWCKFRQSREYTILPASHWRKIIKDEYKVKFGKNRPDQKKAAQDFVKEKFDIEVSEDVADAICICVAGIQEMDKEKSAF